MKRKIKEQANLIQLTFSALNKSGLVFASFLIGGLIFAGVSFWRTLQEDRPIPCSSNIVENVESPHPLGPLSARKTLAESSYDIYKDITYKDNRNNIILDMLFMKYAHDRGTFMKKGFYRSYREKVEALSSEEVTYLLGSDLREFKAKNKKAIKDGMKENERNQRMNSLRARGRSEAEIKRIMQIDPLETWKPITSLEEIKKDLELNEYDRDYLYLKKKDFYFKHGHNPGE